MKFGGFFIALAFVLAACSGDPQPREPGPTSTAAPSSTATPPAMPPQASEDSPEGAAAFVTYWISLVNYAARTGDTSRLSGTYSDCASCETFITALANLESPERPSGEIWKLSTVAPDSIGARATVEILEVDGSTTYDLEFDLSKSQPFAVENIQRVDPWKSG